MVSPAIPAIPDSASECHFHICGRKHYLGAPLSEGAPNRNRINRGIPLRT
jgi:hypothetical protein